jgi:uncharacterized phage-associated protein
MFNERKVAQVAAFFLDKRGGRMCHLKLMKLLYLADREAMRRYGAPISGDRMVAMPHGPVLSMTLDHMDGHLDPSPGGWDGWIADRENHDLCLKRPTSRDALDELSEADIDVLEAIWAQFGHMSRWELRDYTHKYCSEWRDPNGSSSPIHYEDVFIALGWSEAEATELSTRIDRERYLAGC